MVTVAAIGRVSVNVCAVKDLLGAYVEFGLTGVVMDPIRLGVDEPRQTTSGLLTKLENRVHNLHHTRDGLLARAVEAERQVQQADERIGRPFEYEERLTTLTRRLNAIDAELMPVEEPGVAPPADPTTGRTIAVTAAEGSGADIGM